MNFKIATAKARLSELALLCAKFALKFPALSNVYPKILPGAATFVDKYLNRCFPPLAKEDCLYGLIKIFVVQHFACNLPDCFSDKNIFQPIQCGREGKEAIQNIIGDNIGDNISLYNKYVNEYTAIYWVWKHYNEIGNPDYIGFDHYRRYLQWSPRILAPDVIVANKLVLWWDSIKSSYAAGHHQQDLEAFIARFKREFDNAEFSDFDAYWESRILYRANMFIMSRENFFSYSTFMEKCFKMVESMIRAEVLNLDQYDNYQKRVYGFILERMTSYWLYHAQAKRQVKIIAARIDDFEIANRVNGMR